MSEEIEFNPNDLPYELDVTRYRHKPTDELHMFMCDIHSKLPTVRFVADGRTHRNGDLRTDEFKVFNGTEEVGKIWGVTDYDRKENKHIYMYNVSSYRIQNARGQRNRKHSKHYKVILKTALEVFAPVPADVIADKILEDAEYRVRNLESSALGSMVYSVRGNEQGVLAYFKEVITNGPAPIPAALLSQLGNWQDKYATWGIAASIAGKYRADDGVVIRMLPSGEMLMVELTNKKSVTSVANSYGLPVEYQEKLTILKIMELNQPIEGIGVKVNQGGFDYYYMTSGAIQTSC